MDLSLAAMRPSRGLPLWGVALCASLPAILCSACAAGEDEVVAANVPSGDAAVSWDAAEDAAPPTDASWPTDDAGVDHADDATWPGDAPSDQVTVLDTAGPSACGVVAGVTVTTSDRQSGADGEVEAYVEGAPGQVVTGLGLRISDDDIKTFRVRLQAVLPDGSLGPPEDRRAGAEPAGSLEADIDLPDCTVLVGFAARSNSGNAKTLVLWGAALAADGSLGAVQEFRGGSDPSGSVEGEVHAPGGRVISGVGLGVADDNVDAWQSSTDAWTTQ